MADFIINWFPLIIGLGIGAWVIAATVLFVRTEARKQAREVYFNMHKKFRPGCQEPRDIEHDRELRRRLADA